MSIVSLHFWIFACAVTLLYFAVPKKWQWVAVLCGNIYFYANAGIRYLLLLAGTSLIAYAAALKLDKASAAGSKALPAISSAEDKAAVKASLTSVRKFILGVAIVSAGGVWAVLKYADFFISNYNGIAGWINAAWQLPKVSWVLPLGISFYTFHIIGYVVDVYRGKYPAERNFARFFTFVSFFPHMIQGPFTRYNQLGKSIMQEHRFSYDRLSEACPRILWGLFKKLVIADKLNIMVQLVFGNYQAYSGIHILFAMAMYCIQLYADFSGYMDIVCGLSHIWGIDLPENFKQPYFSRSIDEFWRRWHITLGAWFKDYIFYPVSMSRSGQQLGRSARKKWGARMGKLVPGYLALLCVWTATGLWHGASWSFLFWGWLNMLAILSSMQFGPFYDRVKKKCHINPDGTGWQVFSVIRTFLLVCFFRFFSALPSASAAVSTLGHAFSHLNFQGIVSVPALFTGLRTGEILGVAAGILFLLVYDILQETKVWDKAAPRCPIILKSLFYAVLIIMIILLTGGSSDLAGGFMYANF